MSDPDDIERIKKEAKREEREGIADWIVRDLDEIRDPDTKELIYYAIKPEQVQALKGDQ